MNRTFGNPILPGFYPDPSVCRVGDDYYLVTSSFEYFPGVPIFHSRDLVHWRQLGHVLGERRQLELAGAASSGGIFAPTLRHAGGVFYVVTTNVSGGGNFYVTATDPRGPWSDPIRVDEGGNEGGFDPSLLFASDGRAYYSRDGQVADGDFDHPQVHAAPIDAATGKLLAPLRSIWAGTGGVWPEGAHVYERGGRFYLLAAEGGTSYDHEEMVGRGPSPLGPFEPFAGNPILSHRRRADHPIQALGHADLVDLPDGSTWAVFLGVRPASPRRHHLGRETFLAPVTWTPDEWPVIGDGGAVELRMPAPPLPPHPWPAAPARDDFDEPALGLDWVHLRNPEPRDYALDARPGHLRLWGAAATLDEVASPAMVLRRQQHFAVRVRAALDFAPAAPGEEAGLTVRASESFRYDLAVRARAGEGASASADSSAGAEREAVLTRREAGASAVVARARLAPGPVRLEVGADADTYAFAVEQGGATTPLGALPTAALSAEEIGKHGQNHFTGVMLGLYATGNGRRARAPADFDWFEYAPRDPGDGDTA